MFKVTIFPKPRHSLGIASFQTLAEICMMTCYEESLKTTVPETHRRSNI